MESQVNSTLQRNDIDRVAASALPASKAQLDRATKRLHNSLTRLAGIDQWVRLDWKNSDQKWLVLGSAGACSENQAEITPAAVIRMNPDDFCQLADGRIEPRAGLMFGQVDVSGSVPAAMRFCDALAGIIRPHVNYDPAELPQPTKDIARAKRDLAEFGYCLVRDALPPTELASLRKRLVEQAQAEAAAGVASFDGGPDRPNQRVWNLINKGREFHDLLHHHLIDEFVPDLLGDYYTISSYSANIAGPGGDLQILHYDQINVQPPIPDLLIGLNFGWFLDDVSEANGGTRLMPGSGKPFAAPEDPYSSDGTVAAQGPAGTVLIWDSRVWHGTGSNLTTLPRHVVLLYFNRYFVRPQENFSLSVLPEVESYLSERARTMLGFRCTGSLGGVEGPVEGQMVKRPENPIGVMRP